MQCIKLVKGGYVDRVIVFDSLPERLSKDIRTREVAGFPRSWARWLASIGSTRKVMKTTTKKLGPGDYEFTHTPIGDEPCFYILEYIGIVGDQEKWREISEYIRMHVGPEIRLKEKLEDMAIDLAPDCKSGIAIEPEDVPVIPVPSEVKVEAIKPKDDIVQSGEQIIVNVPKKRGRPKKEAVGV